LATSQEPLALEGEQVFRVGMLAVPEIDGNEAALADAPALRLFLIRVREQDHAFCPDASALQSAAELCRRLDGNPLAIELAAAQVPLLGVEGVVRRLSQRFRLLAAGRRTAPAKHRTLKGLMDWSYSLLDSTEQSALRQLGVFAGGFAVEDAISILSDQSCREDAERTLHHLHARSLVATVGVRKRERCTLLETTRHYVQDRLADRPAERLRARQAHARHYAALFDKAFKDWDGQPDEAWVARNAPEIDNLRAAIGSAHDEGDHVLSARLLGSSMWLWRALGCTAEHRQLMTRFDRRFEAASNEAIHARLRLGQAYVLHVLASDSSQLLRASLRAVDCCDTLGDPLSRANALLCEASAHAQLGDAPRQFMALRRASELLAPGGKTHGWYCASMAWASQLSGDLAAALDWARRSSALYQGVGGALGELRATLHAADLLLALGQPHEARSEGEAIVARLRGTPHSDHLGRALANLGAAALVLDDFESARRAFAEALTLLIEHDFCYWLFDHVALLAAREGRFEAAAMALGFADAGYARFAKGCRMQNETRAREQALSMVDQRLDAATVAHWTSTGRDAAPARMVGSALVGSG